MSIRKAITSLILLVFLLPVYLVTDMYLEHRFALRGEDFNQEVWKSHSDTVFRCEMVTDIQDNYLKRGMSKASIIELLGEARNSRKENCLEYYLGFCNAWLWDLLSLRVCFGDNDEMIDASVMQH